MSFFTYKSLCELHILIGIGFVFANDNVSCILSVYDVCSSQEVLIYHPNHNVSCILWFYKVSDHIGIVICIHKLQCELHLLCL